MRRQRIKTRPPQGLHALPEDVQEQLLEWLAQPEITYAKAAALLAEKFDVKASTSALHTFLSKQGAKRPFASTEAGPEEIARLITAGVEITVYAPGATLTRVQIRPL